MIYSFKSKISKATILTIGLIMGLLVIVKGQGVHHIKQFSGVYTAGSQPIDHIMELNLNEKFSIKDENGITIEISVHRLIEKINIIDVSTYFYEVSLKKEGQDYVTTKNTMEVIHNSSTDLVLIDIPNLKTLKRVAAI